MKYLIQNVKECVIAICVLLCVIGILLMAIMSGDPVKMVGAVVSAVITLLGTYTNIPTSEENSIHTAQMRQEKIAKKAGYIGECFTDEADPVDEQEEDDGIHNL